MIGEDRIGNFDARLFLTRGVRGELADGRIIVRRRRRFECRDGRSSIATSFVRRAGRRTRTITEGRRILVGRVKFMTGRGQRIGGGTRLFDQEGLRGHS